VRKTLVVVAVGLLIAADKPKDTKKDADKIQGTWAAEKATIGGKEAPEEQAKEIKIVFGKDGKGTVNTPKGEIEVTYKLDPAKKPKQITLEGDGKTMQGIYKLDGDKLTLCVVEKGEGDRPSKFESKDGTKAALIVLKRAKKK
jgi:uncharacterized protein (TIGR03067 family)